MLGYESGSNTFNKRERGWYVLRVPQGRKRRGDLIFDEFTFPGRNEQSIEIRDRVIDQVSVLSYLQTNYLLTYYEGFSTRKDDLTCQ